MVIVFKILETAINNDLLQNNIKFIENSQRKCGIGRCFIDRHDCMPGKLNTDQLLTSKAFHLDKHRSHRVPETFQIHPLSLQAVWAVAQFQHQAKAIWEKSG